MTYHFVYFEKKEDLYSSGEDITASSLEHCIAKFRVKFPNVFIFNISYKDDVWQNVATKNKKNNMIMGYIVLIV